MLFCHSCIKILIKILCAPTPLGEYYSYNLCDWACGNTKYAIKGE